MKKALKIIFTVILGILIIWLVIFLWPVEEREPRPFAIAGEDPLVIAHRGGTEIGPEATLPTFQESIDLGVDILEYDTHMTEDGELVTIHDPSVDRTTDGSGLVNEMTLEEIKELDAGYHYQDENGEYSDRGEGTEIPTIREVFEGFSEERHLIELKDTNDPRLYEPMIQEMWNLIQEYNMEDQVTIASFDHDINEHFQEVSNGEVAIGAGEQEVTPFVILHILRLNGLADVNADSLQLPVEAYGFDLTNKNLLNGADERNIDIYYWTINDEETMKDLIEKDVDGIMTDRPDLLLEILEESE